MNPKVSIIIPVYNGSDFLQEAIESALMQTYPNIEIIIVNDGSDDNEATNNIALSYGDRVRYFKKNNGGVASALNYGLRKMQGEYFSWLSHDDVYYPEKIEYQINRLKEINDMKRIAFSSYDLLLNESNKIVSYDLPLEYNKVSMNQEIYPVFLGAVNGCTILIHKSHFERVGMFNESLRTTQDYDMWFRMFRNQKLLYIDKPLIKYRIHQNQGTLTINEFTSNCEKLYLDMMNNISNKEINDNFGNAYKFYYDMMNIFQKNNWKSCYEYARGKFLRVAEPDYIRYAIEKFKETLFQIGEKNCNQLCLFCAGQNAISLIRELKLRNIKIDFLSDNNDSKWGRTIEGIKCIPIKEIDKKNTLIIVTKDNPDSVSAQLHQKGFLYITTYDDLRRLIFMTTPQKENIAKHCSL